MEKGLHFFALSHRVEARNPRGRGTAMLNDLHVHTAFSADSDTPLAAYCQRAVELGMGCVCFTDHLDCHPLDSGCGYYDPQAYFEAIETVREQYGGRIRILAGVEFAEPHLHPDLLREYQTYPYDFIIGSIHWVGDLFPSRMQREGIPFMAYTDGYFREVYCAVRHGGFQSLGHLDFPKRYFGKSPLDTGLIEDIFRLMAEREILLEINTSALRKGLREPMPSRELLRMYRDAGNRDVTIGSDAHFVEDLAADNQVAQALIQELGLREVVFLQKQRVPVQDL